MKRVLGGAITLGLMSLGIVSAGEVPERPTFTKDVLPILQERCQDCHRVGGVNTAGMIAPMALMDYQEVRPWAKAIAKVIEAKEMPPWGATDLTLGHFVNERPMTDDERQTVLRWVASGAPRGNPSDAPAPREFEANSGWLIGEPDLIVTMPDPYWIPDDVQDIQPRIDFEVTEEMLPEPRWIQAIECKPGSENVHHIVGSAIAPAWGDHPQERFSAGSIAAGEDPIMYPEGFGNLLRAGTQISLSMHYFKEVGPGTGLFDQSSVGFKFHPEGSDIKYKVHRGGMSARGWEIPPRHPAWEVGGSRTFDENAVLISLHPHMHFRGKSMTYTAFYPDGTTEVLLDVPDFRYAWQTQYIYDAPKFIPKGTRVEVIAVYDNSEERQARHPEIDINRAVSFGAPSTDEMMIPFYEWSDIKDEDVESFKANSPGQSGAE